MVGWGIAPYPSGEFKDGGVRTSHRIHGSAVLVGHPGQSPHLGELLFKLLPAIAAVGAAVQLAVDAIGQDQVGVGGVGAKFHKGELGSTGKGRVSQDCPPSVDR